MDSGVNPSKCDKHFSQGHNVVLDNSTHYIIENDSAKKTESHASTERQAINGKFDAINWCFWLENYERWKTHALCKHPFCGFYGISIIWIRWRLMRAGYQWINVPDLLILICIDMPVKRAHSTSHFFFFQFIWIICDCIIRQIQHCAHFRMNCLLCLCVCIVLFIWAWCRNQLSCHHLAILSHFLQNHRPPILLEFIGNMRSLNSITTQKTNNRLTVSVNKFPGQTKMPPLCSFSCCRHLCRTVSKYYLIGCRNRP